MRTLIAVGLILILNCVFLTAANAATAKSLFYEGRNLYEQKNYRGALEYFQKARDATSSNYALGQIYGNMALCYEALNDYDNVVASYRKAAEYQPMIMAPYFGLGYFYFKHEEYDNAIPLLKKSMDLAPDEIGVYQILSYCYMRRAFNYEKPTNGRVKSSQDWLNLIDVSSKYISRHPRKPPTVVNLYLNRGLAYWSLEHGKEAIEDFKMAVKLCSDKNLETQSLFMLGLVLYQLKSLQTDEEYAASLKKIGLTPNKAEEAVQFFKTAADNYLEKFF